MTARLSASRVTIDKREHEIAQLKASNRLLQEAQASQQTQLPAQPAPNPAPQTTCCNHNSPPHLDTQRDMMLFQIQQAHHNEMKAYMERSSLQMENLKLHIAAQQHQAQLLLQQVQRAPTPHAQPLMLGHMPYQVYGPQQAVPLLMHPAFPPGNIYLPQPPVLLSSYQAYQHQPRQPHRWNHRRQHPQMRDHRDTVERTTPPAPQPHERAAPKPTSQTEPSLNDVMQAKPPLHEVESEMSTSQNELTQVHPKPPSYSDCCSEKRPQISPHKAALPSTPSSTNLEPEMEDRAGLLPEATEPFLEKTSLNQKRE